MNPFQILLVDDDPDDCEFLINAFTLAGINSVKAVFSAQEALNYLTIVAKERSLPKLIVTDLNMPIISGMQLLQLIKSKPGLQNIPVVVFSTSAHPMDVSKCISSGATDYIIKPEAFEGYKHLAQKMKPLVFE